jgi:hypothetical protein
MVCPPAPQPFAASDDLGPRVACERRCWLLWQSGRTLGGTAPLWGIRPGQIGGASGEGAEMHFGSIGDSMIKVLIFVSDSIATVERYPWRKTKYK